VEGDSDVGRKVTKHLPLRTESVFCKVPEPTIQINHFPKKDLIYKGS
jgi:hypothetical protein